MRLVSTADEETGSDNWEWRRGEMAPFTP